MSRRGADESERFTKALINLAARGRRTPAPANPPPHTSQDGGGVVTTAERLKAIFCWLRGRHHQVALLLADEVIILCPACLGGGEVPILSTAKAVEPPTPSAADLQPAEIELWTPAVILLQLVTEGADPRQLLDQLILMQLDPDRQVPT